MYSGVEGSAIWLTPARTSRADMATGPIESWREVPRSPYNNRGIRPPYRP